MSTDVTPQHSPPPTEYLRPAVEVFEDEHALTVTADVPGVAPGDAEVSLDDGYLTVVGRLGSTPNGGAKRALAYRRRFALSDPARFDPEHITAVLRHGVLEVRLPKVEKAKPRQIAVTVN
jgi:HSP20 family protein